MWLSPWDNDVRGGDQLAHSLWAFSTGGPWGSGPGWGDPAMIPAGNTDLVLPAIGEEWGFAGVAHHLPAVRLPGAPRLPHRPAMRPTTTPCSSRWAWARLIALEMMLIPAGVLGAIPLSGVVSPFLSSGNTAMLANFFIFAILLGSRTSRYGPELREHFGGRFPVRVLGLSAPAPWLWSASPLTTRCCTIRNSIARHASDRRRRRQARATQPAPQFPGARAISAAISTTATACCSPPATGTSWNAAAPSTKSSASRSTRPARASTTATIRSGRRPRTCWATCAPARIFTPPTPRWSSTIPNVTLQGYSRLARTRPAGPLPSPARQPGDGGAAQSRPHDPHQHRHPPADARRPPYWTSTCDPAGKKARSW